MNFPSAQCSSLVTSLAFLIVVAQVSCSRSSAITYLVTLNCNGIGPTATTVSQLLKQVESAKVTVGICIVALQEMVPFKIRKEMIGKALLWPFLEMRWRKAIKNQLGKKYECLKSTQMFSIGLFIFVHKEIIKPDTNSKSAVKGHIPLKCAEFDILKKFPSKGSAAIRFVIGLTSVCVYSCHLAPHTGKKEERDQNTKSILGANLFDKCDYTFVMGDLNYRMDGVKDPPKAEFDLTEFLEKYGNKLHPDDELRQSMETVWKEFCEANVYFGPTFKFHPKTGDYEKDEKEVRFPAWCDRILWKRNEGIDFMKVVDASEQIELEEKVKYYNLKSSYDWIRGISGSDHAGVCLMLRLAYDCDEPISVKSQGLSKIKTKRIQKETRIHSAPGVFWCRRNNNEEEDDCLCSLPQVTTLALV